jgi:Uncharacterized conserved protein
MAFTVVMVDDIKFITDASLGKLAKWLRLLGYDTIVFSKQAGREMLRLADAEGRIVLTRRNDMLTRQFSGRLYLVEGTEVARQLNEVIVKLSLKINKQEVFTRCLVCNEKLVAITREEVRNLVPPFVFETSSSYNRCPNCCKIYWTGTHQRNALQYLEQNILSK